MVIKQGVTWALFWALNQFVRKVRNIAKLRVVILPTGENPGGPPGLRAWAERLIRTAGGVRLGQKNIPIEELPNTT